MAWLEQSHRAAVTQHTTDQVLARLQVFQALTTTNISSRLCCWLCLRFNLMRMRHMRFADLRVSTNQLLNGVYQTGQLEGDKEFAEQITSKRLRCRMAAFDGKLSCNCSGADNCLRRGLGSHIGERQLSSQINRWLANQQIHRRKLQELKPV